MIIMLRNLTLLLMCLKEADQRKEKIPSAKGERDEVSTGAFETNDKETASVDATLKVCDEKLPDTKEKIVTTERSDESGNISKE